MRLQASTDTGSLLDLAWTSDGTQLAGAGANGHICFAQVVGLTAEVGHVRATLTDRNSVEVYHLLAETVDELDFRDRVIKMCLGEPLIITHPMMALNANLQHCSSLILHGVVPSGSHTTTRFDMIGKLLGAAHAAQQVAVHPLTLWKLPVHPYVSFCWPQRKVPVYKRQQLLASAAAQNWDHGFRTHISTVPSCLQSHRKYTIVLCTAWQGKKRQKKAVCRSWASHCGYSYPRLHSQLGAPEHTSHPGLEGNTYPHPAC